jgi:polyhydroxybutyrate depolymerase
MCFEILFVQSARSANQPRSLLVSLSTIFSALPLFAVCPPHELFALPHHTPQYLEVFKWIAVVPFGTADEPTSTCCPEGSTAAECESGVTLDKVNPCSFNAGSCCGPASLRGVSDVDFAKAMVQYTVANMCADSAAVFATGFSNGAMMSNRLGCQAAGFFKATAPVAGNIRRNPLQGFGQCEPTGPVGWVSLCGDRDLACNWDFEATALEWASHNGCAAADPKPTFVTDTTTCYEYQGCQAHTEFCIIAGLDHEWPGHARPDGTSPERPAGDVDATAFIFDRFSAMLPPLRPPAVAGATSTRVQHNPFGSASWSSSIALSVQERDRAAVHERHEE